MPAPDIILQKPQVLLSPTTSGIGGVAMGGGMLWGYIEVIYDTSDLYVAGDTVLYNSNGAQSIYYSSVEYHIITEDKIMYKEVIPP